MKTKAVFSILIGAFFSLNASATVSPSSLVIKLYALWVSPNTDCSNPINLFDGGGAAMNFDMIKAPTLGGGNPADGTYPCLIMKMSSVITYSPASSEGSCSAGASYSASVCRADNGGTTTPFDGSSFNADTACTGTAASNPPVDNTVFLYLSTVSTGTNNAFNRPTVATKGINLGAPFVVSGSTAGTFVVNANGKIDGSGASCGMNPPVFSFH
jgi:hypothetical protein